MGIDVTGATGWFVYLFSLRIETDRCLKPP